SEKLISFYIKQLLNAILFLHNNNIVHLDISPQSIIINETNNKLYLSKFDTCTLIDIPDNNNNNNNNITDNGQTNVGNNLITVKTGKCFFFIFFAICLLIW